MTPRRTALLLAVHRATIEMGRAPYASEIAMLLDGSSRRAVRSRLRRARDSGHVTFAAVPRAMHPSGVRLTPAAKVELGLPVVVLGAWPADDDGTRMAESLAGIGIIVATTFVSPAIGFAWSVAAGAQIAPACDGVVVLRDRLLLGRADVHAARVARLRCSFVSSWEILSLVTASTIWAPPFLEPDLADVHTRAAKR